MIERPTIIDGDLFLWVYEQYMERKGKPLSKPVRHPRPGSPEEQDYRAATDEYLMTHWPEED